VISLEDEGIIIIKFGGSAITNKNVYKSVRKDVIKMAARELREAIAVKPYLKTIIVLGGGSFGHPLAKKYKLQDGIISEESLIGISKTIDSMRELSLIVSNMLREEKLKVVPIQPSSIAINKNGKLHTIYLETLKKFLEIGLIPILWGDVVYDVEKGCSILSGDEIVSKISLELNVSKVIYGLEVDGIFTDPIKLKGLVNVINDKNLHLLQKSVGESKGIDVTGGMIKKIDETLKIYQRGIPVFFINLTKPNNLYRVLVKNENVGTLLFKGSL